jgi:ATP-binding cassette, subfamily B, bacterial
VQSQIHSHVQRALTGMPIVQAFAQEDREHLAFRALTDAAVRAVRRGTLVDSFAGLSTGLTTTVGTGVVLFVGARMVLAGELTLGSLLVFLSYLATLQHEMGVFTGIYRALQGAGASIDRVMEVLDAQPEVADAPGARPLPAVAGHVRIEGVTFGYETDRPVLRDVTLEARPGEVVALVGATGAGKSTLVGLVPRFNDPWSGRVSIDGHDLREVQVRSVREQVALVLQEPFLFPLTIAENIAYGRPDATREEIEAAARAANAHAFISRLPDGYDSLVGERGATLSGGERQRVSIARALLKDAPILILDEPTSALDAETEALLLEALERLMAGRTTLIIAHRLSTIRNADRIVVLRDGQVAEQGTHAELLARNGVYARLHALQAGRAPADLPALAELVTA